MKKLLIITFICTTSIFSDNYIISNGGQAGDSNQIAVYDFSSSKSTLVAGYSSKDSDNGHCATGFLKAQTMTIIIPEQLGKSGRINQGCQVSENSSDSLNFNLYNCAVPIKSEQPKVEALYYQPPATTTTKSNTTNTLTNTGGTDFVLKHVLCDGLVQNGATVSDGTNKCTVYVSDVCCGLALNILNNFAQDLSTGNPIHLSSCNNIFDQTKFTISEYANCGVSDISYCSVTFVPRSDLKVRVNTDYLMFEGNYLPGVCSIGSASPTANQSTISSQAAAVASVAGAQAFCNLLIRDTSNPNVSMQFTTSQSINDWVANNFSSGTELPPPNATFNYSYMPSGSDAQKALSDQINAIFSVNKDALIAHYLANPTQASGLGPFKNTGDPGFAAFLKTNPSIPKTKPPIYIADLYKTALNVATQRYENDLQSWISNLDNNKAIPCSGSLDTNSNGDPVISYICQSPKYNPQYTCHFSYSPINPGCAASGDCLMQLYSAYCNIPMELIFDGPQIPGGSDFDCGFCGISEAFSVGLNRVSNPIETGSFKDLAPFSTNNIINNPSVSNGFFSDLTSTSSSTPFMPPYGPGTNKPALTSKPFVPVDPYGGFYGGYGGI